jgi:NAD(P)H-quinone oxidoreductase subunit 4L
MSSKSSVITLAFVALGTILVCAYSWGYLGGIESVVHIPADIVVSLVVGILAILAVILGGESAVVTITATLGVFVTLTIAQQPAIRFMTLAALLFCLGFYGMVTSRNAIRVLMSIELMLNAVNINLVALSRFVDPGMVRGQVFAIFVLTIAAAEAAAGLAIVLAAYRNMSTVDMEKFNLLRW